MFIRTENGIYDVTYWNKDDKGYYTYCGDDWCEPKHYIYNDDIINKADNLEDLIDEYRYTSEYGFEHQICDYWRYGKTVPLTEYDDDEGWCMREETHRKQIRDSVVKGHYVHWGSVLCDKELETVKGYIWIDNNLICIAEMKEYGDGYKLFLKERE